MLLNKTSGLLFKLVKEKLTGNESCAASTGTFSGMANIMHALLWIDNTMVVFYITILQATLRWAKKLWKWVDPLLALRAAYLLAWHRQGMCCLTASLYPAIWKSTCCCYWQALLPISPRLSEMTTHLEIMDFLGWFQHTEMLGKGLIHCCRCTYAHKWFFSPKCCEIPNAKFLQLAIWVKGRCRAQMAFT